MPATKRDLESLSMNVQSRTCSHDPLFEVEPEPKLAVSIYETEAATGDEFCLSRSFYLEIHL